MYGELGMHGLRLHVQRRGRLRGATLHGERRSDAMPDGPGVLRGRRWSACLPDGNCLHGRSARLRVERRLHGTDDLHAGGRWRWRRRDGDDLPNAPVHGGDRSHAVRRGSGVLRGRRRRARMPDGNDVHGRSARVRVERRLHGTGDLHAGGRWRRRDGDDVPNAPVHGGRRSHTVRCGSGVLCGRSRRRRGGVSNGHDVRHGGGAGLHRGRHGLHGSRRVQPGPRRRHDRHLRRCCTSTDGRGWRSTDGRGRGQRADGRRPTDGRRKQWRLSAGGRVP